MGQDHHEKVFPVHTSSILHGDLVHAGSLWRFVGLAYQGKDIIVFRFILEYIVA
jgi:hypothetical protein